MRAHVLTLLVLFCGTPAAAQTPPTSEAQASADAEFAEGQKAFEQKAYGAAASHFTAAYERVNNPLYLFNAAQAYRLNNDCYDAWEKYEAFRIQVQDKQVNGLDRVQEYLKSLRECHDKGPSQDNPVSQPPQPQPQPTLVVAQPQPSIVQTPEARPSNGAAYALVVGGVAVLGLAVGAEVHEEAIHSTGAKYKTTQECASLPNCGSYLQTHYNARGEAWSGVADAAYPVGGLALLAGIGLIYLHRNHGPEHMVTVAPTAQGGEVLATWRF
jgi:hypothetical protein